MKKLISFFLSIVMLVSVVASVDLSAYAAETNDVDQNSVGYSLHSSKYYNEHFNFDMPSYARDFHNILTENELFMGKVVVWETAHIVTSPGHLLDSGAITLEEYYKTVLFDLIAQTDSENGLKKLLSYATNKEASYIVSLTKTITKPLEENSLKPETLNKLSTKEAAKLVTDSPLYNTASAISTVTKILSWAKDSVELVEAFSKHLAVADMKDGTEEFLRAIANDTRNPIELRNAANDCISYFGDGYEKVLNQICAGTWDIAVGVFDTVADVALDWAWGLIVSALVGPAGSAALLGIKGARVLSNYLFSSDKEIEEYYKITAECIIEIAIRNILNDMNSQKEFLTDFYASQLYMCTIDMFKKTILLGFDYSIDFLNVCADSNLETSIVPWQRKECLELIEEIKGVKALKESNFEGYERNCLYEYKIKYCSDFDSVLNGVQNQNIPIEKITLTQIKEFEAGIDFGLIGDYITIEYYPTAYTETVKEQWSSSNEDIIQVTEDSTLFSTNKPGSCKLTCTLSNGISSSIDVVVGKGDEINTEENIANYNYSINDDSVIITRYIGNSPNAMIPSKIQGLPVTSIGDYAFQNCTSLTSVAISDSVTSIGSYAFWYCINLTNVVIPNNVKNIGSFAFYECMGLTSVIIGNNVISIGESAFRECKTLTNITIPNSVKSISDYTFYGCSLLTDVILPSSITSIGKYAFCYCINLFQIVIPDSVTRIGDNTFEYCSNLKSVVLGDNVKTIGVSTFHNCKSLASIIIPDSVTSIGDYAFRACLSLSSVAIGNNVISIGSYAFYNCISLTSMIIGNSTKSIGDYAFAYCTNLDNVVISNSVNTIGKEVFSYCTNLSKITIGNSVTSIGSNAFIYCTNLKMVNISSIKNWCGISFKGGYSNPLYYAKYLYYNNKLLTDLIIPDGVTSIAESAFENCLNITSISIPDSITSIGDYAFYNCVGLLSVTIPSTVTNIGNYAFGYVNNIKYHGSASGSPWGAKCLDGYVEGYLVYKNSSKTDLLGCSAQATCVTIPNTVTSICDYAFSNCVNLTNVLMPNSLINIGYSSFVNCTSLDNVIIPNSVINIGSNSFSLCTSLSNLTIGTCVTNIGSYAFNNCTSLTNVTIAKSVKSIGEYVFNNCSSLILLTIPSSVTSIGRYAFNSCTSLIDVYYIGSETQWKNISIESHNDVLLKANIHYINDGTSCEHSWGEWVYNGDAKYVSGSNYTDGTATRSCTECGETETKTIAGTGLLRARTATCEFASEVRAMLGVRTEQTKLFSNVYCKFTREDGKEFVVNSDKSTLSQDKTTAYYPFAITPQSLHSDIKVQFYAVTNDGITVWGQEFTYNMMDNYIKKQIANTTNESWRKLLVELVYYGYENQIKSCWKLDQLLIDELTEEQKALHSTETLTLNKYLNTSYVVCENPLTSWRSVNLEFGASTNPVFRTRALALTDDIKAVVTIEGDEKVYTYNYSDPDDAKYFKVDADVASDTTGIYFTFGELPAKRLRSKIYVTLYKGDTPITNTLEYSAETYCNSQSGKDPNMTEQNTRITQQLMRYGNAARAYFGI